MTVLVVFESMFGNTQRVAQAIARGMAPLRASVVEVGEAPDAVAHDVDLVVVGGPTHAFSMSRANTRQDAQRQAAPQPVISSARGIREWLDQLQPSKPGMCAAAFDTRVRRPRVPGSAARAAARALRAAGFTLLDGPQSFWVAGVRGPLQPDQEAIARAWGAQLAAALAAADVRGTRART